MGRILFVLLAGYVLVLAVVYVFQRYMMYYPDRTHPGTPTQNGVPEMREVAVTAADGTRLLAWFAPPRAGDGRIVVFFHGNAGHIGHRAGKARHFLDKGYGVYLCEYRGYGGNAGRITEEGLYRDARAALAWLEEQGYAPGRLVLYGESIGAGVAVQMAREFQPRSLILEAPFSSAADVAKLSYFWLPVDLLLKDRFDNAGKIAQARSALLVVHGDEDRVIPPHLSRRLFDAANHPKEYVVIERGGHNDLYDHHAGHVITDWLEGRE